MKIYEKYTGKYKKVYMKIKKVEMKIKTHFSKIGGFGGFLETKSEEIENNHFHNFCYYVSIYCNREFLMTKNTVRNDCFIITKYCIL